MKTFAHNPKPRRRPSRALRQGFYVVGLLWFLVIGLLLSALTLNWAYFVTVQRDLQARADAIALAAAPSLLDEQWLISGNSSPTDIETGTRVKADEYRELNNAAAPTTVQIADVDLTVTPGRLNDPAAGPNLDTFVAAEPYDTLRVDVDRTSATGHPIEPIMQSFAQLMGVDIRATAMARLDSQVVGFRPTTTTNAPLMPFAIEASAWATQRTSDSNSNQITELTLRIAITAAGVPAANGAVVSFEGPVDESQALDEISDGVSAMALTNPNHEFGPVHSAASLDVAGLGQISSSFADELLSELGNLADPVAGVCRAYPLFDATSSTGGDVQLVGFVAGRVLSAERDANELRVVIEPCYLIHTTVWTDNGLNEFNSYLHKLVLVR